MMKKATWFMVPFFVVAFSLNAFAQAERDIKTGGQGKEETLKVTINGGGSIQWVQWSSDLAAQMSFTAGADTADKIVAHLHLDIHASIQDNIDLHIRVKNDQFVPGSSAKGFLGPFDHLGLGNANDLANNASIEEAYLSISELFDPAVTLRFGQMPYTFDVRGAGNPLFLALGNSEQLWANVANTNIYPGTAHAEDTFAGIHFNYARDKWALNIGVYQNDSAGLLSGPSVRLKERVFAVDVTFDVTDDGSKVGIIAAVFAGNGAGGGNGKADQIFTIGASALINVDTDIEVFVEAYSQSGDTSDAGGVDAGGLAFRVGGMISFPGETPAWVELSYTSLSGDDPTDGAEDANFYSYENDDDLLIFSSNEWGMDIDRNLTLIKVKAGVTLTNGITLIGKIGMAEVDDDSGFADDAWGMEIDATLEYGFNKNAKVFVTIAFISGNDIADGLGLEDSGMMFMIGSEAGF